MSIKPQDSGAVPLFCSSVYAIRDGTFLECPLALGHWEKERTLEMSELIFST